MKDKGNVLIYDQAKSGTTSVMDSRGSKPAPGGTALDTVQPVVVATGEVP